MLNRKNFNNLLPVIYTDWNFISVNELQINEELIYVNRDRRALHFFSHSHQTKLNILLHSVLVLKIKIVKYNKESGEFL